MDFWSTVLVLIRRWYIAVPAFVASLGLAAAAYEAAPLQYQSSCVLVLTTPLSGGTESTGQAGPPPITNPLVNFDQSLSLTATIVIQQMNSYATATSLGVRPGSPVNYEVSNGSSNPELLESGPLVFIQGTGPSPAAARDIADRAAARAAQVLAQRQAQLRAPESTRISMRTVVRATLGRPLRSTATRSAAAALALAGVASLVAVFGFESLLQHRRRRRAERECRSPAWAGETGLEPGAALQPEPGGTARDLVLPATFAGSGDERR